MAEVKKLWIPESQSNQGMKLECLKLATVLRDFDIPAGGGLTATTALSTLIRVKDVGIVVADAQKMYDWITKSNSGT
jgi:hypothetical protein